MTATERLHAHETTKETPTMTTATETKTAKRAATYSRVSTRGQAAPDKTSIAEQQRDNRIYAKAAGWDVVATYADEGVSGSLPFEDRPKGSQLLADAEAGRFEALIVYTHDRIGRDVSGGLDFTKRLRDLGIDLRVVQEEVDTETPIGRLFQTIRFAISEFEREQIQARTTKGRKAAAEAGRYLGSRPPIGYRVEQVEEAGRLKSTGKLIEDPAYARAVRRAFELRLAGYSHTAIADKLNAEGYLTRPRGDYQDGAPFEHWTVGHILSERAYAEGVVYRKLDGEEYEYKVPALIDSATFAAANRKLKGKRGRSARGKRETPYALAGRIEHRHEDGSTESMFCHTRYKAPGKAKGGERVRDYRCMGVRQDPMTCGKGTPNRIGDNRYGGPSYGSSAISADIVEAAVARYALHLFEKPERLAAYAEEADRRLAAAEVDAGEVDLEGLRARLDKLDSKRERYVDMFAEGIVDKETRDERLAQIADERETLVARLGRLSDIEAARDSLAEAVAELMSMPVEDTGERDPAADETSNLYEAIEDVRASLDERGSITPLPDWAIAEVERLASALDLVVILSENPEDPDPRRPLVEVEHATALDLHEDSVSGR